LIKLTQRNVIILEFPPEIHFNYPFSAGAFERKNARITLRISDSDLARLKQQAAYKGLPYQTFIASVLHEYAAGHFEEKYGT
jgi:predicted DNA binding CopG/RHH family protein